MRPFAGRPAYPDLSPDANPRPWVDGAATTARFEGLCDTGGTIQTTSGMSCLSKECSAATLGSALGRSATSRMVRDADRRRGMP